MSFESLVLSADSCINDESTFGSRLQDFREGGMGWTIYVCRAVSLARPPFCEEKSLTTSLMASFNLEVTVGTDAVAVGSIS